MLPWLIAAFGPRASATLPPVYMNQLEVDALSEAMGTGPVPTITTERGVAACRRVVDAQGTWSAQFFYELAQFAEDLEQLEAQIEPFAPTDVESDLR